MILVFKLLLFKLYKYFKFMIRCVLLIMKDQYLADNQLTAKLEQWKLVFIVKLHKRLSKYL